MSPGLEARRPVTGLPATVVAIAFATFLSGCGSGVGQEPAGASVTDSAGVRIVSNPSFDPPDWPVGTPTLTLGTLDEEGPEQFYGVAGATWFEGSDGRVLALADMASAEIRLFTEEGAWIESWGRRGEGPGEFQAIGPIWRLPGDSLLAWDGRLERMTVLAPDGEYVRQFRRPPVLNADPVGRFGDGSMLFAGPQFAIGDGFRMIDLALSRVDADGTADSLPAQPYAEYGQVGPPGSKMISSPMFAPQTAVAADAEGYWVARGTHPHVRRYAPDGTLRMIARWPDSDRTVTSAAAERFRERALSGLEGRSLELRSAQLEDQPVADRFATTGYAIAGHDGELWVTGPDWPPNDSTTTWRVVRPDGFLAGSVTLPKFPNRFIPLHVGVDHVIGNVRDELGVEYVHVVPIDRGGS